MPDLPLPNDPASRTPTGEIKDQGALTTPTPDPKSPEASSTPELNADGTPKTPEQKAPEAKTTPAAPEKYETFTVPEGFELPEETFKQASELFKEMNLPQDQAQKLVDFHTNALKQANDAGEATMTEMRTSWRSEVMKDPTLGNGTTLKPEVSTAIGRMIDGIGDAKIASDFREAMNLTGVGDNPAFIRAMHKLALQVTEGRPVAGTAPTAQSQAKPGDGPKTAANALYPNLP